MTSALIWTGTPWIVTEQLLNKDKLDLTTNDNHIYTPPKSNPRGQHYHY